MTPRTVHGVRRPVTTLNVGAAVPPTPLDPILVAAVAHLGGKKYGVETDCVRATFDILNDVYDVSAHLVGDAFDRFVEDIHISHGDASRPWSPIDAAIRDLGATFVPSPDRGHWHLVQGWRRLDGGKVPPPDGKVNGHAFFYYAEGTGDGLLVNANLGTTPWAHRVKWADVVAKYPAGVRLARLP